MILRGRAGAGEGGSFRLSLSIDCNQEGKDGGHDVDVDDERFVLPQAN